MKKAIFLFFIFSFASYTQESDFTYDEKSKSIIPKYLGKVFLAKGEPRAIVDTNSRILEKESKVYKTETIKTDKSSIAKIEMVDQTIVTVAPSSEIVFSRFDYKTKNDRKSIIRMATGKMRAYYKIKAKEENDLKINVRHLAMGIRGTKVLANAYEKDGKQVAQVALLSGNAIVYDKVFDKEYSLKVGDEYISVIDHSGKKIKNLKRRINQSNIDYLLALDKNPEKYFRPFLQRVSLTEIGAEEKHPSKKRESQKTQKSNQSNNNSDTTKPAGGNWRKTLDHLNSKLKESNQE